MKAARILIVDDDAAVLDMLSRLLAQWGHEAIPFARFEEARAFLEDHQPDALVVDVRLGQYNGLQLLHLARRNHPQIPVIVLSGFDDPVLRADAAEAGAAYLLKPLELPILRDQLAADVRP